MILLAIKEWKTFYSSFMGIVSIALFLTLLGLLLFVFPTYNVLEFGYASLGFYFQLIPTLFFFLIPAITMNAFAGEFSSGTMEILKSLPFSNNQILWGKFWGCYSIILTAIFPTLVYVIFIQLVSVNEGLDWGETLGSYIGLLLLAANFVMIGICCSIYFKNTIGAFVLAALSCFVLYQGFTSLSQLQFLKNKIGYYIEMGGIEYHYSNISRGFVDSRELVYFAITLYLFYALCFRKLNRLT